MKAAPLALACVLLGATALVPASFAQTSSDGASSAARTPAESSPSTASPDAASKTGTQAQADWRDEDGRSGATSAKSWRTAQDDDRFSSRGDRGARYSDEDDEDDNDDMMRSSRGPSRYGNRMGGGSDESGMGGMRDMRMDPEMMRMHMRMMMGHHGGGHGAHLKLKRGDSSIDIHCPSGESTAACVDAVGKLMDRLHNMPQTSGGTAPQTPAPATPNR